MGYSDRINTVKSEVDALITYANETTEAGDTTICDAVRTLVDGYGGGGAGGNVQRTLLYSGTLSAGQTSLTMDKPFTANNTIAVEVILKIASSLSSHTSVWLGSSGQAKIISAGIRAGNTTGINFSLVKGKNDPFGYNIGATLTMGASSYAPGVVVAYSRSITASNIVPISDMPDALDGASIEIYEYVLLD